MQASPPPPHAVSSNGEAHYPAESAYSTATAVDDPLRVDVESARRHSSLRRRPTRDAEVEKGSGKPVATPTPAPASVAAGAAPVADLRAETSTMPRRPSGSIPTPVPVPAARSGASSPRADADDPTAKPSRASTDAKKAAQLPGEAPETPSAPLAPAARPKRSTPSAKLPTPGRTPLNRPVCPFCGHKHDDANEPCPSCGLEDNDQTRGATVARAGPWFLLQNRNPSAPGMRFTVLKELVRTGQISAGSVVRGPTTQQLWTYAARVRGLAHYFGICWSCARKLPRPRPDEDPDDFCIYCGSLLTPPGNPDQQLEALGTSESVGAGLDSRAGQIAGSTGGAAVVRAAPRGGQRGHVAGNHGNHGNVEIRDRAVPPQAMARRANMPRPLPPTPGDGGDALLTTRELATAFNLERRQGLGTRMARLPWAKALAWLVVLTALVAGAIVVYQIFFAAPADETVARAPVEIPAVGASGDGHRYGRQEFALAGIEVT